MCRIVNERIDVPRLESRVSEAADGAVMTFLVQARAQMDGVPLAYVEYDAYVPMAEKTLKQIAEEVRERWAVEVAIEHRTGRVEPGEVSFAICIGARRSADALEACQYCLDNIKQRAPIWRKEVRQDGAYWLEGEDYVRAVG